MSIVPPKVKARVRWYLLGEQRQYKKYCVRSIEGSAFVFIGGGQLVKNNISLFCDRLCILGKILKARNIPYAFIGVGIDGKMSTLTWYLTRDLIKRSKFLAVRDTLSQKRIKDNVKHIEKCHVLPDLAFALENPALKYKKKSRKISIGINVMSISALLGSMGKDIRICPSDIVRSYCKIIMHALETDSFCVLFTSGSADDLREAKNIRLAILEETGIEVSVFHPENLDELLEFLVGVRDVFAARMHVGILAYISGCNPVCINWDDKVLGVWSAVGQEDRVIELAGLADDSYSTDLFEKLRCLTPPSCDTLNQLTETVRKNVAQEVVGFLGNSEMTNVLTG
jgi:polysaccharide pyruvyl transferase WcaK-like protein